MFDANKKDSIQKAMNESAKKTTVGASKLKETQSMGKERWEREKGKASNHINIPHIMYPPSL
jgi:hypothetical protein